MGKRTVDLDKAIDAIKDRIADGNRYIEKGLWEAIDILEEVASKDSKEVHSED